MKKIDSNQVGAAAFLETMQSAGESPYLDLTFKEGATRHIGQVLVIAPKLLMFENPGVIPRLEVVARDHQWHGMSRTHRIILRATMPDRIPQVARVFDLTLESLTRVNESSKRTRQTPAAVIADVDHVISFDEGCFRETCQQLGCSGRETETWINSLQPQQKGSNMPWIVRNTLRETGPDHVEFMRMYVHCYFAQAQTRILKDLVTT